MTSLGEATLPMAMPRHPTRKHPQREAIFSPCRLYRYTLSCVWHDRQPMLGCILLNPSTADEMKDDPTTALITGHAQRANMGGWFLCNAFAFRATDPKNMKRADDPVGPDNDDHIRAMLRNQRIKTVMVGWGTNGSFKNRYLSVLAMAEASDRPLMCLGTTKGGQPRHPLYQGFFPLTPWEPR